ncbi:M3 family oligoendopeptidase [soil metagenome]
MKFSEYKYEKPDLDKIKKEINALLEQFNDSKSASEQVEIIGQINKIRGNFGTMFNIGSINYSIDTNNKFYEDAKNFFDENSPVFTGIINNFYKNLLKSKFRSELEKHYGPLFFKTIELSLKSFSPEIIEDMKKENALSTEYGKLTASAKIMFEGEERNIAGLAPFMLSTDRGIRKAANDAKWKFYADNSAELDRIFDDLVKVRNEMAIKLGYKNFIEMGYARLYRTDYGQEQVNIFRNAVHKFIVPLTTKLRKRQAERLGLAKIMYYDAGLDFNSGNAAPKGSPDWIVDNAKKMYEDLSGETSEFINFMLDRELMDLVNKKGKEGGGYCTFIEDYKSPFIFSNFNGTADDVTVLTHEAGHAFQAYCSRNIEVPEYQSPTMEACEIHSMSMELITWPWMNLFFKEDTDKFKFSAMATSLCFIPYGTAVDEFQHKVYENPEMTPAERNAAWREVESKYLPDLNYDSNEFLQSGGRWQHQRHIYEMPFYYIDYCLAQICAYQFWKKSTDDMAKAMKDYISLCEAGGTKSFLNLLNVAKINSPFDESSLQKSIAYVDEWLETIDDKKF